MLNYSVKLHSVKDLMELKKITDRYGINGRINQNQFQGNLKAVFKNLLWLPLDEARVEIDDYSESQVSYITEAMSRLSA